MNVLSIIFNDYGLKNLRIAVVLLFLKRILLEKMQALTQMTQHFSYAGSS